MTTDEKISAAIDDVAKRIDLKDVFHEERVGLRAVWQTVIDLIFACAPISLLAILSVFKQDIPALSLLGLSDWSLIATFLFGQAVIKIFQLPYNTSVNQAPEPAMGVAAILICLGLLPSAIIFAVTFGTGAKTLALLVIQMIWFMFSVAAYIFSAYISNAATILKTELTRRLEINVREEVCGRSPRASVQS
jgi:hypothetical protein